MEKKDLLAALLISSGEVNKYVIYINDPVLNKQYFKYAFIHGYPEHYDQLAKWMYTELIDGEIYELSGYTGDAWSLKDGSPISIDKLLNKKFNISVNELNKILESQS